MCSVEQPWYFNALMTGTLVDNHPRIRRKTFFALFMILGVLWGKNNIREKMKVCSRVECECANVLRKRRAP